MGGRRAAVLVLMLLAFSCAPQLKQYSGRNPDLFDKPSDHLVGESRGMESSPTPGLYVKEKGVVIKEDDKANDTGSLFNPDDERNYLFTPNGPLNVGRFLTINVVPNRLGDKAAEKGKGKGKDKDKDKGKGKDKDKDKGKKDNSDEVVEELLKALPDLTPAEKGNPSLLKSFKMQIAHRFDNGDVMAMLTRTSQHNDQINEIDVRARIPYDRLSSGDELTTDDLLEVRLNESKGGELVERASSGWEDEYSLRLSGFDEVKSKQARDLAEQKDRLMEAKDKLENKMNAFGEERRQFAKQREDLAKKKADTDAKLQSLEDKVKEQESTIQSQDEKLQDASDDNGGAKPAGKPPAKAPAKAPTPAGGSDG